MNDEMPLTQPEAGFLSAYAFEYMRNELGSASRKLKERGLVYHDLAYLLEAYVRENGLETSTVPAEDGTSVEVEGFGRYDPDPPGPPWADRETARRRNNELLAERDRTLPGSRREPRGPLLAVITWNLLLPLAAVLGAFAGWCLGASAGEWLAQAGLATATSYGGTIGGAFGAVLCVGRVGHVLLRDDRDGGRKVSPS